jgi:ABC-type glycerol-3-phosphate transport system permease component
MEPDARAFLKRVLNSLFAGIIWLALNSTFGIMYGYAFPENKITIGNIIFYVWFIASLCLLIWILIKLWKESPEEDK